MRTAGRFALKTKPTRRRTTMNHTDYITPPTQGKFTGKDLTGTRFGRLTVTGLSHTKKRNRCTVACWTCLCGCGKTICVESNNLKSGNTSSCGCFRNEKSSERFKTHGRSHSAGAYNSWVLMKQRCYNPNCHDYPDYGGRGIIVCERWSSFEHFIADMGECPKYHSINRIKNDGNYEPSNCQWASSAIQSRNRRSNRWITFKGRTQVLQDWASEIGISASALSRRLVEWPMERALNK